MKNETLEAVNSACMYFQHDFGLLSDAEQEKMRYLAKEWFHAWEKVEQDLSKRSKIIPSIPPPLIPPPPPPGVIFIRKDSDIPESEKHPCSGLMGKVFGHKYEPIYDEHVSAAHGNVKSYYNVEEILEKYRNKDKVYVRSICKRCGNVIEKLNG
jgi:hypothetical protein